MVSKRTETDAVVRAVYQVLDLDPENIPNMLPGDKVKLNLWLTALDYEPFPFEKEIGE